MFGTSRGPLSFLALALVLPVFSADIDTTTLWNGTQYVSSFGIPNTQTYGQVIVMASDVTKINSFSFRIRANTTLAFRGEIYAWDGAKATGSALYESSPVSTSTSIGFQTVTFNTGGINVTAGQAYVLFASSSKDNVGHSGFSEWGYVDSNTIPSGNFVFQNNGTNTGQWTTTAWSTVAPSPAPNSIDLAMTVAFEVLPPVPPPVLPPAPTPVGTPTVSEWAMLLMAGGIGVIAIRALRRAQSA
jgi:hypothetical protein